MDNTSSQDDTRPALLSPKQVASIKKLQALTGQDDLFSELVESFFEDAQLAVERLGAAIETGEVKVVEEVAHKLKGASGNLGANRLMVTLGELEKSAAEGGPLPEGIFARVETDLGDSRLALMDEIARVAPV